MRMTALNQCSAHWCLRYANWKRHLKKNSCACYSIISRFCFLSFQWHSLQARWKYASLPPHSEVSGIVMAIVSKPPSELFFGPISIASHLKGTTPLSPIWFQRQRERVGRKRKRKKRCGGSSQRGKPRGSRGIESSQEKSEDGMRTAAAQLQRKGQQKRRRPFTAMCQSNLVHRFQSTTRKQGRG